MKEAITIHPELMRREDGREFKIYRMSDKRGCFACATIWAIRTGSEGRCVGQWFPNVDTVDVEWMLYNVNLENADMGHNI